MIRLRQVTKAYNSNALVLQKVDLDLKRGEFLFVVGESGTGKTSLLKLLSGEEKPTKGSAMAGKVSLAKNSRKLRQFRQRLGIIHQDFKLLDDRSVLENISIPLYFGRAGTRTKQIGAFGKGARQLVLKTMAQVDLPKSLLHKKVRELSGGEKQRVAVARAIINEPDVLIADEPTGSLDHDHTWAIMDLFQKLNLQGMTVVVATHDQDIVRRVRKKTCHLKNGELRFDDRAGACIF